MTLVILLSGPAGSGKSTVAQHIKAISPQVTRMSFASPIKEMLRPLGLEDQHLYGDLKEVEHPVFKVSPRHMMQTLGTEWGRQCVGRDMWADLAAENAAKAGKVVVFDDYRFPNEFEVFKKDPDIFIPVTVELQPTFRDYEPIKASSHASETATLASPDLLLINDDAERVAIKIISYALRVRDGE